MGSMSAEDLTPYVMMALYMSAAISLAIAWNLDRRRFALEHSKEVSFSAPAPLPFHQIQDAIAPVRSGFGKPVHGQFHSVPHSQNLLADAREVINTRAYFQALHESSDEQLAHSN